MKFKDLKTGQTLIDLITGKQYKCVAKDTDEGLLALDSDGDCSDKESDIIMNEANAACFHLESDPNLPETPEISDYSVVNGVLMKDGDTVCNQGDIRISCVITVVPGGLLLGVVPRNKANEKKELIDLFFYHVENDRFRKLIRSGSIPLPTVIHRFDDGRLILAYSRNEQMEIENEDGEKEMKEVFDCAALMLYANETVLGCKIFHPLSINGHEKILETGYGICVVMETEDTDCGIRKSYVSSFLIEDRMIHEKYRYEVSSSLRDATVCRMKNEYQDSLLIRTENALIITDDERIIKDQKVLKELDGFRYLIGAAVVKEGFEYILANDRYESITLKVSSTRDRGFVCTVE